MSRGDKDKDIQSAEPLHQNWANKNWLNILCGPMRVFPRFCSAQAGKSSFSGFFSQFVMSSSENRANSENLIHTGGLQVPNIG